MNGTEHHHLLVIGGQRCGTTWLQNVLSTHPDVSLPFTISPEPKYFLADDDHERYDQLFPSTGGRWLLDKSTTYLEHFDAAKRAAKCVPDACAVAVVRDPVERAYSNWRFSVAHGIEDLSVEDGLDPCAESRPWGDLSTSPYHYLRRGRYADLLVPWASAYGARLVVLQYESMTGVSGAEYLADQCRDIGLMPPDGWPVLPPPANAVASDRPLAPEIAARLSEYFAGPNSALVEYGVDLLQWS